MNGDDFSYIDWICVYNNNASTTLRYHTLYIVKQAAKNNHTSHIQSYKRKKWHKDHLVGSIMLDIIHKT